MCLWNAKSSHRHDNKVERVYNWHSTSIQWSRKSQRNIQITKVWNRPKFYIIYEHTVLMAEIVNVQPYIPRICFRADKSLNDLEPESNRTDTLKAIAWEILQSYSSKMYV